MYGPTSSLFTPCSFFHGISMHLSRSDKPVVEVAPIYDNPGETTVLAAAEIALSLIALMVTQPTDVEG